MTTTILDIILAILNKYNAGAVLTDTDIAIHNIVEDDEHATVTGSFYCDTTVAEREQFVDYIESELNKKYIDTDIYFSYDSKDNIIIDTEKVTIIIKL